MGHTAMGATDLSCDGTYVSQREVQVYSEDYRGHLLLIILQLAEQLNPMNRRSI